VRDRYTQDNDREPEEIVGPEDIPEPDDFPQPQYHPKKKRRKKHFFLNLIIVILALIGLYFFATSDVFAIREIKAESTGRHFTDAKIVELSGIKKGDNLFKTRTGKAGDRLEKDPYIESAEIKRKLPGTIEIKITERQENYLIASGGGFIILDWPGIVLSQTRQAPKLPVIEGIKIASAVTGSAIEAERQLLLESTVKLLRDTEKAGLYFKRVAVSDLDVTAYIYDSLSVKGELEDVDASLEKVKVVLLDLTEQKIKRGTIIVGSSGNCIFSPEQQ
jgi:cell division protein FtsQ